MADNSNGNSPGGSGGGGPYNYEQSAKFNPTTAVVIISLIGACFLLAFVSVSLRRCLRGESAARTARSGGGQSQQQSGSYNVKSKGLEKSAVDALPLVHRADLDAQLDASECPVCLTDFEPDEPLRLLPSCKHVFHQECIDAWFDAHSTCPLCRASLLADATPLPADLPAAAADPAADLVAEGDQPSSLVPTATPPLDTVTESGTECEPVKEGSFRKPSMRLTGDLIALRNLVMRGQNEAPSRRWFTRARSLELGRGRVVEEREEWVTIDLETGKAASSAAAIAEAAQGSSSSSSISGSSERALPPERAWSERWSLRGAVRFPLTRSTSDVSSSRPSSILPI